MPAKNTFFWHLSGPDIVKDTYVLGTMHVQDLRAFSNLDHIKARINTCAAFAAEYHLGENQVGMSGKMGLPTGVTLKSLISEKRYNKLRKTILKSTGINLDFFQTASPFLMTGLIGSQLLGKEMPHSLDEHLWKYADESGKILLGIETLNEQLEVLEKISIRDQVRLLLSMGKNINRFRKHTIHSAILYQQGELKRLSKSVIKNAGKLRKLLVYQRNEIMAERIHELAMEYSLFATVGAGHLGGGKGVLRLLKKRGLKVKPIRQSDS